VVKQSLKSIFPSLGCYPNHGVISRPYLPLSHRSWVTGIYFVSLGLCWTAITV